MTYDVVMLASDESKGQLREAVESVNSQYLEPNKIIIVTDKEKLLNTVNENFIFQSEGGIGEARRIGYEKTDSEWVLFTDADTVLPPDFTIDAINYAHENNLDAVGGKIKPVGDTPLGFVFSAVSNFADFGKGHSTLIKIDINFSKINSGRGEDSDIWSQARNGSLLDFPKVETAITQNHKTLATILFLIAIWWIQ